MHADRVYKSGYGATPFLFVHSIRGYTVLIFKEGRHYSEDFTTKAIKCEGMRIIYRAR